MNEPAQEKKKPILPKFKMGALPLARENPFKAIGVMAKTSIVNLPGHLVVLFFVALSITVLFGVVVKFAGDSAVDQNAYMAVRLKPDADKPALAEDALKGVWVVQKGSFISTLRIANGFLSWSSSPRMSRPSATSLGAAIK